MQTFMMIAIGAVLAQAPGSMPPPRPAAQTPAPSVLGASQATAPVQTDVLATQVMLDRAGFSPGAIDGRMGSNTRKALARYQQQNPAAAAPAVETLTTYAITPADTEGPLEP